MKVSRQHMWVTRTKQYTNTSKIISNSLANSSQSRTRTHKNISKKVQIQPRIMLWVILLPRVKYNRAHSQLSSKMEKTRNIKDMEYFYNNSLNSKSSNSKIISRVDWISQYRRWHSRNPKQWKRRNWIMELFQDPSTWSTLQIIDMVLLNLSIASRPCWTFHQVPLFHFVK